MKVKNILIKAQFTNKITKENVFVFDCKYMHGDADGYSTERSEFKNPDMALLAWIFLNTEFERHDKVGYDIDDLVETFKKTVELPEGLDPTDAFIMFVSSLHGDQYDCSDESDLKAIAFEQLEIISNDHTCDWHYAANEHFEVFYYNDHGYQMSVTEMSAKWEDLNVVPLKKK